MTKREAGLFLDLLETVSCEGPPGDEAMELGKELRDRYFPEAACGEGHSYFLRSYDPHRELPYEYECNLCSTPHLSFKEEQRWPA